MSMSDTGIAGLHIVRYGTAADQSHLLGAFLTTYDQLVINANMVAHTPAALASFVTQKAGNKPYFIDPLTHAFQHDISHLESSAPKGSEKPKIKRSISRLLREFGEPVESCILERAQPLRPKDLEEADVLDGFCNRVLQFQHQALSREAKKSDAAEYYKFIEQRHGTGKTDFGPSLLVAPYFYLTAPTSDEWLSVNLKCAESSKSVAKSLGKPLAVQIVLSKDILVDEDATNRILKGYLSDAARPEVFLIWVDSFSEHEASARELGALASFLERFKDAAPVVNLYGGFFSVALARTKLRETVCGVVHGLEYGEDRGVVPVGGGLPIAKFYLPPLRRRLAIRNAYRPIRGLRGFDSPIAFTERVCGCPECRRTIVDDAWEDFDKYGRSRPITFTRRGQPIAIDYPLPETKQRCVRHYMWSKASEYDSKQSTQEQINQLRRSIGLLEKTLGPETVSHCIKWLHVLSSK